MIQIDHERCIRCGLCAKVCPLLCFRLEDGMMQTRHEEYCMRCGQCTAVCPSAAVSLEGAPADSLRELKPFLSFEDFDNLARGRRSVRAFKDAAVPHAALLRALDCARYAPTGKNFENVTWLVIEGKARLRKIADAVVDFSREDPRMAGVVRAHDAGRDPIFRDAPCAVFALADSNYDFSTCNCDIAVSYLELALPTLGLGACWAGLAMRAAIASPEVRTVFGAPEGLTPFAGLMVGLPELKYRRIPARRELRVTWLSDND